MYILNYKFISSCIYSVLLYTSQMAGGAQKPTAAAMHTHLGMHMNQFIPNDQKINMPYMQSNASNAHVQESMHFMQAYHPKQMPHHVVKRANIESVVEKQICYNESKRIKLCITFKEFTQQELCSVEKDILQGMDSFIRIAGYPSSDIAYNCTLKKWEKPRQKSHGVSSYGEYWVSSYNSVDKVCTCHINVVLRDRDDPDRYDGHAVRHEIGHALTGYYITPNLHHSFPRVLDEGLAQLVAAYPHNDKSRLDGYKQALSDKLKADNRMQQWDIDQLFFQLLEGEIYRADIHKAEYYFVPAILSYVQSELSNPSKGVLKIRDYLNCIKEGDKKVYDQCLRLHIKEGFNLPAFKKWLGGAQKDGGITGRSAPISAPYKDGTQSNFALAPSNPTDDQTILLACDAKIKECKVADCNVSPSDQASSACNADFGLNNHPYNGGNPVIVVDQDSLDVKKFNCSQRLKGWILKDACSRGRCHIDVVNRIEKGCPKPASSHAPATTVDPLVAGMSALGIMVVPKLMSISK